MTFLPFFLLITFIGIILLKLQNRSMIGGVIFSSGLILTAINLFSLLLDQIYTHFKIGNAITLGVAYVLIPIIFLVICIYILSNSKTMRSKEGKSITANLSAALGTSLLVGFPALIYLIFEGMTIMPSIIFVVCITLLLVNLILIFLFVAYILYSWIYQKVPLKKKIDYIIILGSGIRSEEVPPLLKSRLDKGIEYYLKNPQAKIVVSGGQGIDEPVSEAFAMKNYLLSQMIRTETILVEDQSTTTFENMLFSKKIIEDDWIKSQKMQNSIPTVVFSTNNYHVLRGAMYARKVHLKAEGIGSPTAFYFLPSALIREYIALLVYYKLLVCVIIILVFITVFVLSL